MSKLSRIFGREAHGPVITEATMPKAQTLVSAAVPQPNQEGGPVRLVLMRDIMVAQLEEKPVSEMSFAEFRSLQYMEQNNPHEFFARRQP